MHTHLFFDLDGTITDSRPGIIRAAQHALRHFGINARDEDLLPFIGPPLLYSFQQYCGMDAGQAREAVAVYREYYREQGIFECTVYAGVAELLQAAHAAGRVICLATSKPEVFARRIVEHFDLARYFDFIGGATLQGDRDSKEAVLAHACAALGRTNMTGCLLVGDRVYDVQGAEALGMDCAGVLYGYGAPEEFLSPAVVRVCRTVAELHEFLLPEQPAAVPV